MAVAAVTARLGGHVVENAGQTQRGRHLGEARNAFSQIRERITHFVRRHPVPVFAVLGIGAIVGTIEGVVHGVVPLVEWIASSPSIVFGLEAVGVLAFSALCGMAAASVAMASAIVHDDHRRTREIYRIIGTTCAAIGWASAVAAAAIQVIGGSPAWTDPVSATLACAAVAGATGWAFIKRVSHRDREASL